MRREKGLHPQGVASLPLALAQLRGQAEHGLLLLIRAGRLEHLTGRATTTEAAANAQRAAKAQAAVDSLWHTSAT